MKDLREEAVTKACVQNRPWIKLWGFLYICIYFITCSDTNYLHTQIKKNSDKLIAIVNAKVFIYGALKLLSRN